MQLYALSELSSLSDYDLLQLHDRLHEMVSTGIDIDFLCWYHSEVKRVLLGKQIVHRHTDDLDVGGSDYDYEILIDEENYHRHTAMMDKKGNGFTDPVVNHFHLVRDGYVLEVEGHTHELQLPKDLQIARSLTDPIATEAKSALERLMTHGTLCAMRTDEQKGHAHAILLVDLEGGFGVTSMDEGHAHWITDHVVQAQDGHRHHVEKDNVLEIPNVFHEVRQSLSSKNVVQASANDAHNYKDYRVEFGKPSRIPTVVKESLLTADPWEMWGSAQDGLLITPQVDGYPLEAHLRVIDEQISVWLFIHETEIVGHFKQIRDSLRLIPLVNNSTVILAGVVTTKSSSRNPVDTVQKILDGEESDGMAAFYVEDCWLYDCSLDEMGTLERRKLMESLLAHSSTPALRHLPRAYADSKPKAIRVTQMGFSDERVFAVRWRNAESLLIGCPEELIVKP
jgi:hypothetical protein